MPEGVIYIRTYAFNSMQIETNGMCARSSPSYSRSAKCKCVRRVCVVCARVRTRAFMCANEIPDIRNNQLCNQCSRDRTTCCDSVSQCRHFLHRLQVAAQVRTDSMGTGRATHTHTTRHNTFANCCAAPPPPLRPGGVSDNRVADQRMLKRDNKNTWWRVFAYVLCVCGLFSTAITSVCVCLCVSPAKSIPAGRYFSQLPDVVVAGSRSRFATAFREVSPLIILFVCLYARRVGWGETRSILHTHDYDLCATAA